MLSVTRKIHIPVPQSKVAAYLRNVGNLAKYESKVETCIDSYPDSNTAIAEVRGRYLGLPWKGTFRIEFTSDGGFRSRMTHGPLKTMRGGFQLKVQNGGTLLTHYEQYFFPTFVRPFYLLIRRWLARNMDAELKIICSGSKDLCRKSTPISVLP